MQKLDISENPPPSDAKVSCCGLSGRWRLPLLLTVVLAAIISVNWRGGIRRETLGGAESTPPPATATSNQTVTLAIRDESNSTVANSIPWRDGMTVRDLLVAAAETDSFKGVKFSQQGDGESAFLTQLGDVTNEGAGARNWTYAVNGEHADRSFAVYQLRPGDKVLWKFDDPR